MKNFFTNLKAKMDFRNETNVLNVTKYRRIIFFVPVIIVLIACILGAIYDGVKSIDGFANIGIDFQGGTVLTVTMNGSEDMLGENQKTHEEIISKIVKNEGFEVALIQASGSDTLIIRYKNVRNVDGVQVDYGSDELTEDLNTINRTIIDKVKAEFEVRYPAADGNEVSVSTSLIGATASTDLIKKACLSVGIALIVIFIYIIFRFDFFSGICAIIALLHDIVMMLAMTVIFRVEMNSEYVAALITIVSYSINNSIIVFDRVRSLVRDNKKTEVALDPYDIANRAVTGSISRTLLTTLTTTVVIVALIAISVTSVRTFGLPILFGLIAGFFSAVFIAPSLWAVLTNFRNKRLAEKAKYEKDDVQEKVNPFRAFVDKVKNGKKDKVATKKSATKSKKKNTRKKGKKA